MSRAESETAQRIANYAFASTLARELARAGVRHVVVSPGSRSAPLAIAVEREVCLRVFVHHDERAAGFFALGLARTSGRPVALVCTSGSAAANYLPAVVEAHYGCVPLVVLTADRPAEVREWGAGQTIDQVHLYGTHVRWFAEAPVPCGAEFEERHCARLARRAVTEALGRPAGAVHLNLPFREPLDPPAGLLAEVASERASPKPVRARYATAEAADVAALVAVAEGSERGVIVCGGLAPDSRLASLGDVVAGFAHATGWPVLVDPLSQLRRGAHTQTMNAIASADLLLRDAAFASAHAPEAVLRLGESPTSKALRLWLEAAPPADYLLVDPESQWHDPSHLVTEQIAVDPVGLLAQATARLGSLERSDGWDRAWRAAERAAQASLDDALRAEPALLEPRSVRELGELLPEDALLIAASSMPIRDVDAFLSTSEQSLRVMANRGANGIDGTLSTALGAAACWDGRVVLLTGDLAFLHDIAGLSVASRLGLSLTIVLLNNDGGGIFSFLPVAARASADGASDLFEALFRTPHGIDLSRAAELFGLKWRRVASWGEFRTDVEASLSAPGVQVIELPIDRDANVAHFRALARAAGEAGRRAALDTRDTRDTRQAGT
jgi:2-succinyl-5-enolpyruvyl-6-hydroxy-3-cyclohexene-1-carboxylate synthase